MKYKGKQYKFVENVNLDAAMLLAAMRGGIHGYMNAAFLRKDEFPDTDTAMARSEWFKKQDKAYTQTVINEVIRLEKL